MFWCELLVDLTLYSFSHDRVTCRKSCSRLLECGHPCTQPCCAGCRSDCECSVVEDLNTATKDTTLSAVEMTRADGSPRAQLTERKQQRTSSQYGRAPLKKVSRHSDVPLQHSTSAHLVNVASGAQNRDIQQETQPFRDYATGGHVESDQGLAVLAEQEQIENRQKRLDDEAFASLFGNPNAPLLTRSSDNVELVRTKSDGEGGSRRVWKGTFEVPRADTSTPKDQGSLMDLL